MIILQKSFFEQLNGSYRSQELRFSREILEQLDIAVDDKVNVEVVDHKIIISKANPTKVDIQELFKNYKGDYKGEEFDWG